MHSAHFSVVNKLPLRRFSRFLNLRNSGGYAVAEFAIVLPALTFVTFLGIFSINVCIHQLEIQSVSAVIARTASRGDMIDTQTSKANRRGIRLSITRDTATVTVIASQEIPFPFPGVHTGIQLKATSAELIEGDVFGGFGITE